MGSQITEPKILIVDDHAVVRGGIQHLIKSKYPGATFFECDGGDKALEAMRSRPFDLAFLDVSMPGKDGIETLQEMKQLRPNLPVIMLSVFREEAYAIRAFQLGAAVYLQKGVAQENLFQAVDVALAGRRYVSPELADKISEKLNDKLKPSGVDSLSPKEHSIFLRLASGKSLKEIAAELEVSPKTVTTYRSRILEKLKLDSNAAIAKYAIKNGLIE